jgi:hypothetical protein
LAVLDAGCQSVPDAELVRRERIDELLWPLPTVMGAAQAPSAYRFGATGGYGERRRA